MDHNPLSPDYVPDDNEGRFAAAARLRAATLVQALGRPPAPGQVFCAWFPKATYESLENEMRIDEYPVSAVGGEPIDPTTHGVIVCHAHQEGCIRFALNPLRNLN